MATLAQLLASTRDRLDESTAAFWTDVQLRKWINEGARDLARKTESLQDRATIVAVAGTQEYSMPADIVRVHRVEYVRTGDTMTYPLEYRDFQNLDEIWYTSQTVTRSTPVMFTMWGFPPSLKLVVYPTPDVGGAFKVFYYRLPAALATDGSGDGSTIECPAGWEDLIVDFAEFNALRKDGNPQWSEAKGLYDERLEAMFETTRRWSDQAGMIVSSSGAAMVPSWLYAGD